MRPMSPVLPGYEADEINVGEGQKQYTPIPTLVEDSDERRFISRWEFTDFERQQIYEGADLILQQLTFGEKFQPVSLTIHPKPEIDPDEQVHFADAAGVPE